MNTEPKIGSFLDEEEQEIFEAMSVEGYEPKSVMTPEAIERYREAARSTINEGTERVQLRIARTDLARIKAKALKLGIPYQTYIKSILHQDVS